MNIKSVMGVASAKTFDFAVMFITPIILTRFLLVEDYADYRFLWLVIGSVIGLANFYIPQAIVYFLSKYRGYSEYLFTCITILLISSLFVSLFTYAFLVYLGKLDTHICLLIVIFLFMWSVSTIGEEIGIAEGKIQWQVQVLYLWGIYKLLAITLSAIIFQSFEAVLYGLILMVITKFITIFRYINKYHVFKPINQDILRECIIYSWPFCFAALFFMMRSKIEQWIVYFEFSSLEFASFGMAFLISPIFMLIRTSFMGVTFPTMNRYYNSGKYHGFYLLSQKVSFIVAMLIIPLSFFIYVFAEPIIKIVYTEKYFLAAGVMQVTLLGTFALLTDSSVYLRVLGAGKLSLKLNLAMIPIVAVCSLVGLNTFGLKGAALGSVVALYLSHILTLYYLWTKYKLQILRLYQIKKSLILIAFSVASLSLTHFISSRIDLSYFIQLPLVFTFFISIYFALLISFGFVKINLPLGKYK
jgi:O-antigen/teichoic acid export membrane protein